MNRISEYDGQLTKKNNRENNDIWRQICDRAQVRYQLGCKTLRVKMESKRIIGQSVKIE